MQRKKYSLLDGCWGLSFCIVMAVIGTVSWSANVYAGHTGSYSIELVDEPNQAFLPADHTGTVIIRINGPGTGAINSAKLRLNGKRVTAPFRPTGEVGSIIGTVPGFKPGDNLIQLYANVYDNEPSAQLRTSIALQPQIQCIDMAGQTINASEIGLPTEGAVINQARIVPASQNSNIANTTPEYCELTGVISPVTSSGLDINFRVAIPTHWNQKSWQFGGGGTDGSIPNLISPSISAMLPINVLRPIALGYATYGGDSGHTGFFGPYTWIDNPDFPTLSESFQNFTFDSLKKTHDAAVAVMKRMYGKAPALNYFAGQSQGGREALTVLWRYTEDYDGIMAQDFLAYFANLNFNPQLQGSMQVSDFGGTWVPSTKGIALSNHVKAQCDGIDGLSDGIIQNYLGCAELFDPSLNPNVLQALNCGGATETDDCLTDGQITTLTGPAFLSPVEYSYPLMNGETSYPGWGPYEGLTLLTSSPPVLANGASYTGAGAGGFLGIGLVREYFCGTQTGCNVLEIFHDLDTLQEKIQVLSEAVDISDDWSQFKARGGKVIIDTSAADSISNPLAQFKLLDRVKESMGQTAFDSFVRYYVSPMTGHGGGGSGATVPTTADLMNPMIAWVERLVTPPDVPTQMRITTSGSGSSTVYNIVQSRPLCQYPFYPHYNGSGDPNDASSFTCTAP